MYIHVHTYIHTYIHTYVKTYIHTYIHTNIHTYIHTYIQAYIHTSIHTYKAKQRSNVCHYWSRPPSRCAPGKRAPLRNVGLRIGQPYLNPGWARALGRAANRSIAGCRHQTQSGKCQTWESHLEPMMPSPADWIAIFTPQLSPGTHLYSSVDSGNVE